jgi:hypothetical protein
MAGTGGTQGSGVPDASAGGTVAGNDGGATSGGGSAGASTGGGSGTTGSGGSANGGSANGGSANGGSANGGSANGGSANGGAGGGPDCTNPTMWYVDADQDGYGSSTMAPISSCIPPPGHFTKVGDDCDDSNDMVHPQLTAAEIQYFAKPYQTPGGTDSFDYDCSGKEDGDPGQTKAASSCPALTLGSCGGSGYRPVSTGNRVAANAYCGSTTYRTCVNTAGVTCSAQDNSNFSEAYRCK